jgi:hypothetical protein
VWFVFFAFRWVCEQKSARRLRERRRRRRRLHVDVCALAATEARVALSAQQLLERLDELVNVV